MGYEPKPLLAHLEILRASPDTVDCYVGTSSFEIRYRKREGVERRSESESEKPEAQSTNRKTKANKTERNSRNLKNNADQVL